MGLTRPGSYPNLSLGSFVGGILQRLEAVPPWRVSLRAKKSAPLSFVVCDAVPQIGSRPSHFEVSRSRLVEHPHIPGRTPLSEGLARRRGRYIQSTQQTQETDVHSNPQSQQSSSCRPTP